MKPLTAVREYHYWSERLVSKLWEDNVSRLPDKIQISAGISNCNVQTQRQDSLDTRAARADAIEDLLADHVVTDLDYIGPLTYLRGRSQIVLSSLRMPQGTDTGAVTLFSDLSGPEGKRVAVCLFGSAQNVCGWDPTPPRWRQFGWTSSSNEGVQLLLKAAANAEGSADPELFWRETAATEKADLWEIAWNALNICSGQGSYHGNDDRSWHRGYTIGHYADVEWLAQIYFTDHDPKTGNGHPSLEPFDIVHVGAAFWVRSGTPRAWMPYTTKNVVKLDAAQHPLILRPFARAWYSRRGQHMRHSRQGDHR
jgi:hypothetical protein